MASNIGLGILGGLGGLSHGLYALARQRRSDALEEMRFARDEGTFVPVPGGEQPERSFLQHLFGGGLPPDYFDLGRGSMYRLERHPQLGPEGAMALDLTYPETRSLAPRAPLTMLEGTPAGPALPFLPTPTTLTEEKPLPGAAEMRLGPKERLEVLKERARQKREQAQAAARTERTRLWLQRTPSSVAKYEWLINSLDSDDETTRTLAEAELSRMQSPSRRVDLGEDRLAQQGQQHQDRLAQRLVELDKRIAAAQQLGDTRAAAALARLRERLAARWEELQLLEEGRNSRQDVSVSARQGSRASDSPDMKTAEAEHKLTELRQKWYFPGTSSQALDTLDKIVAALKKQERSHIGTTLTKRLQRLETLLNNAERRGGIRPQTPPGAPPGTRPQPSSSSTTSGTLSPSDQPTQKMVDAFTRHYQGMSPDEAVVDLQAEMAQDRQLQARGIPAARTVAKQQAYSRVFPERPLTMRFPGTTTPDAAPAPVPVTPAAQEQGRAQVPQAAPPPQAQAVVDRYTRYYEPMSDQELDREAKRLQRATPTDTLSAFRQQALDQVRAARKTTPQPDAPAPPAGTTPQQVLEHWRAHYQHQSTADLLKEQRRLMNQDRFGTDVPTSLRISAINQLITARQSTPARRGKAREEMP